MTIRLSGRMLAVAGFLLSGLVLAQAQTVLRIFTGNQPRLEVLQQIVDGYMRITPDVKVEIETGGASSEQQQNYLRTILTSKDPALDLVLLDVLHPAQWAAAQWAEPLDAYLGAEKEAILARLLPVYRTTGVVNGRLIALPYSGDAQFLYYRKDLLEKHNVSPPRTWDELKAGAQKIMAAEGNARLRGFETAGAPVEGAVCTYLVPLWGAGEELLKEGKPNLSGEASRKPFQLWAELKEANVTPNLADISTDRIRQNLQSGNLIFGMSWGYVWNRLANDVDSTVKGKIGVMPLPGLSPDRQTSCIGGWQIAVSAFSKNKAEAAKLARYLSSPEVAKQQAMLGGNLPVFTEVYQDADVLNANPWFAQALPALQSARARPVTPRYIEVSEIIRTNMHAVLAGTKSADQALGDMNTRLGAIFR